MYQRFYSTFRRSKTGQSLTQFTYVLFLFSSWVPAAIFFNEHVAEVQFINGSSMYPFLNTGFNETLKQDLCLVNKRHPTKNLKHGMLVSFWSPFHPESLVTKRIIALEGDRVYTRAPYPYPYADIPAGHVWVEGDNSAPNKSLDSNTYGPMAMGLIVGKVTHVIWPWNQFGPVRWWQYKGKTKVIKGWNAR